MESSDARLQINLDWSDWIPVRPPDKLKKIPNHGGVYRITHIDTGGIEYVGRSFNDLRNRVQKLAYGIRLEEEPESKPHIAAPHLWRLRQGIGSGFMVSWLGVQSNDVNKINGIWATYLSNYRTNTGRSPAANFGKTVKLPGRYPEKHGEEKPLFADFRSYETEASNSVSWEDWKEVESKNWMGLEWSEPHKLSDFADPFPATSGIYRTKQPGMEGLERIEATSNLRERIYNRAEKIGDETRISFCELDITGKSSETELEVDLMAAHYTANRITPDSDAGDDSRATKAISEKAKELLDQGENSAIEFKDFRFDLKDVMEELVAFANSGGGEIFIGVTDSGKPGGLPDIDSTEEDIANKIRDCVNPNMRLDVKKPEIEGTKILWYTVPEAREVLYSCKGRFLIRNGTTKVSLEWGDIQNFISKDSTAVSEALNSTKSDPPILSFKY